MGEQEGDREQVREGERERERRGDNKRRWGGGIEGGREIV